MDKEVQDTINGSILANAKLARAVEILVGCHMSTKEKEVLSKRIDACANLKELDDTMRLIQRELHSGYADPTTGERWSPVFVEQIRTYFEEGFPFNPMKKLAENFVPIKEFMVLQEVYIKVDDPAAKELMKKDLDEKRATCMQSMADFEKLLAQLGA